MSNEENKKTVISINANTIITALFGLIVSGIGLVNHQQGVIIQQNQELNTQKIESEMLAKYETQQAHLADISDLQQWNKTISTSLTRVESDIAEIKGEIRKQTNQHEYE